MDLWVLYGIISLSIISFCWEVYIVKYDSKCRVSYILDLISYYCIEFFKLVGKKIAWISSYLWYIEWNNIRIAIARLCIPTWNILISWSYIGKGYVEYAVKWTIDLPILYAGSALILMATCLVLFWYFNPICLLLDLLDWKMGDRETVGQLITPGLALIAAIIVGVIAIVGGWVPESPTKL